MGDVSCSDRSSVEFSIFAFYLENDSHCGRKKPVSAATRSGIANDEDRMAHVEYLFQLNHFENEIILRRGTRFFGLQVKLYRCFAYFAFEILISTRTKIVRDPRRRRTSPTFFVLHPMLETDPQ